MNEKYFNTAYNLAKKAYKKNEVPVGAVIVKNNKIISKSYNNVESKKCVFNHAEINCIKKASKKLKNWRLINCDLYVTLEPCKMCEEVIKNSRLNNVYYMIHNNNNNNNNKTNFIKCNTILNKKYQKILKQFFKEKR